MSPCPCRATAKDSLESSYFKEKPLRKLPLAGAGGLWVLLSPLPAPLTPSLPHSLRARAHAHLSPPPQQAGSCCQCGDREPGEAHQALSPGPWGAQRVPAGMVFCCRTAPALPAPPPLGWILNSIPQAGWGSTGIPCPPARDQAQEGGETGLGPPWVLARPGLSHVDPVLAARCYPDFAINKSTCSSEQPRPLSPAVTRSASPG